MGESAILMFDGVFQSETSSAKKKKNLRLIKGVNPVNQ